MPVIPGTGSSLLVVVTGEVVAGDAVVVAALSLQAASNTAASNTPRDGTHFIAAVCHGARTQPARGGPVVERTTSVGGITI